MTIIDKLRTTCPDCRVPEDRRRKVPLHFEVIMGLRVYREVQGLKVYAGKASKVYKARCPSCGYTVDIDGGKA